MDKKYCQFLSNGESKGARYSLNMPQKAFSGGIGIRNGNHPGSSLEFKDFRDYQPGDDLRQIDWSAYARSNKLIIKMFQDEVSPHLDVVIDGSCSMSLENTKKLECSLGLLSLLTTSAENAKCTYKTWIASDGIKPVINGSLRQDIWEGIDFQYTGNPEESLEKMPPKWRSNGMRILISDLLWMSDPYQFLCRFSENAAAVIIIQVMARTDIQPFIHGNTRLFDCEEGTDMEIFIDDSAKQLYKDTLARHQENWIYACRKTGAIHAMIIAEETVTNWHLPELEQIELLGAL